jgi:hypothetical protein
MHPRRAPRATSIACLFDLEFDDLDALQFENVTVTLRLATAMAAFAMAAFSVPPFDAPALAMATFDAPALAARPRRTTTACARSRG